MVNVNHPLPAREPNAQHVRPSETAQGERPRKSKSGRAQAAIWFTFLALLALLLSLGLAYGLLDRVSPQAPDLEPGLPTLPGQQPTPRQP